MSELTSIIFTYSSIFLKNISEFPISGSVHAHTHTHTLTIREYVLYTSEFHDFLHSVLDKPVICSLSLTHLFSFLRLGKKISKNDI